MSFGSKTGDSGTTVASEATSLANPITFYKTTTGLYPSNGQVWWSMKRPPELGSDAPPKLYLEVFDPSLRYQVGTGNTPVAKGHYILNAFQQDRSALSGVAGLEVQSSKGVRPSCVAFFAGRVWYAGVNTATFNTKLYFSQIVDKVDKVGLAYQVEDPTAEDLHDLLPNDGGVIEIPEMAKVINMVAYDHDLFVFANNGVWHISGGQGGFRADDFNVTKLSGVPSLSIMSFILVEGAPMWCNLSGIWSITTNDQGQFQVSSMTDATIKTLYETIPDANKYWIKGAYDPLTKKVQYLYRSTAADTSSDNWSYDQILTLDIRTNAFSPWSAANDRVSIKGIFDLAGNVIEASLDDVSSESDDVLVDTDPVTSSVNSSRMVDSKIKYIVNIDTDVGGSPETPGGSNDPANPVVSSISFFDGFDTWNISEPYGGLNVQQWDDGQYWFGSTASVFASASGGYQGRCAAPDEFAQWDPANTGPELPADGRLKCGFWAKIALKGDGSGASQNILVGYGHHDNPDGDIPSSDDPDWSYYAVRITSSDGKTLQLTHNRSGLTGGVVSALNTDTWNYYEFGVDTVAGTAYLKQNGVTLLSGTTSISRPPATNDSHARFKFGALLGGIAIAKWKPVIDNFWYGGYDLDTSNGLKAVAVRTMQDRNETTVNLRGALYIDEGADGINRYVSTVGRAQISAPNYTAGALDPPADDGIINVVNEVSYIFPNYPPDGSAWTEDKYNKIVSFGVCVDSIGAAESRLVQVSLSRLDFVSGHAEVTEIAPGPLATYSGNFRRSDPSQSLFAHLNKIPRDPEGVVENMLSVYCSGSGCLQFSLPYAGEPETPLGGSGIAFAEEFRTDYLDWVRVSGTGQNFSSFLKSAYVLPGQGDKKFQDNYVTVNYDNVEGGQAYIQGLWDYSTSDTTGRWSQKQTVYAEPYAGEAYRHAPRKLKIRGTGRAMQIHIFNKDNSPFKINGWTVFITGNQVP